MKCECEVSYITMALLGEGGGIERERRGVRVHSATTWEREGRDRERRGG